MKIAQKLSARKTTSATSTKMKAKMPPAAKDAAPTKNFKPSKAAFSVEPMDTSVLPDGTAAPKSKRSTRAPKTPQVDSLEGNDPGNFQESFADGGEAGEDEMPPEAPRGRAGVTSEDMTAGLPGKGVRSPTDPASGNDPIPWEFGSGEAEAMLPGLGAMVKKWGPLGLLAMLPVAAKSGADAAERGAESHLDRQTQSDMDDASAYQGAKTSQMLSAQKYLHGQPSRTRGTDSMNGPPDQAGAASDMSTMGSDRDRATATEFLRHLKKNTRGGG